MLYLYPHLFDGNHDGYTDSLPSRNTRQLSTCPGESFVQMTTTKGKPLLFIYTSIERSSLPGFVGDILLVECTAPQPTLMVDFRRREQVARIVQAPQGYNHENFQV